MAIPVLLTLLILSVHQAYATSCFTDTGGHWAETFICWMKSNGLSSGYVDGTFRPDNTISRAEAASLLYHYASSGTLYINSPSTDWTENLGSFGNPPEYGTAATILHPGAIRSFCNRQG